MNNPLGLLNLTPEQMQMLDEIVYNSGNVPMNPANIQFDSQSPEMQKYIEEYTRQQQEKLREKMNPQTPIIYPIMQIIDQLRMQR